MGTSKNVTWQEYNGTDYDVLLPQPSIATADRVGGIIAEEAEMPPIPGLEDQRVCKISPLTHRLLIPFGINPTLLNPAVPVNKGGTGANNEQQAMINAALSDTTIYPDNYTMLYSSNTLLINIETTNTTELTNTITTSNSIITYLGEDKNSNTVTDEIGQTTDSNTITNKIGETTEVITETITSAEKICTKTTTTITDYFEEITTIITTTFYQNTTTENITQYYQNTTTTTTTNYYMDTLTTTDYYQTTNSYVNFLFNSVQQNNKQKLILFTTTYWSETAYSDNSTSEYNYRNSSTAIVTEKDFNIFTQKITTKNFNTTDTQTMTEFFNNITTTITWNCTPIPQNNTTIIPEETNNETIPMQDTGAPLIYLAMAGLIILGGAAIGRRK